MVAAAPGYGSSRSKKHRHVIFLTAADLRCQLLGREAGFLNVPAAMKIIPHITDFTKKGIGCTGVAPSLPRYSYMQVGTQFLRYLQTGATSMSGAIFASQYRFEDNYSSRKDETPFKKKLLL
jgi:hypothetical protein